MVAPSAEMMVANLDGSMAASMVGLMEYYWAGEMVEMTVEKMAGT